MADESTKPADAIPETKQEDGEDDGGLDGGPDVSGDLKLTSKDNKEFTTPKKHAFISVLVKTSIENDENATEVPLPGVEGDILEMVVEYMTHHQGVEPSIVESPLKSTVMKEVCQDDWDATFIDEIGVLRQDLYDLILAANYMDIKSLLHLGLAKVASLIKGQPLDKLKDILSTDQPGVERKRRDKLDH